MSDALSSIVILVVVIVMFRMAVSAAVVHYTDKLMYGVPWLRWLTFQEIVEMGHPRFWATVLLPLLYRKGYVEIRISDKLSRLEREHAEQYGLLIRTVDLYEYKFT